MADHGGAAGRAETTASILRALSTLAPEQRRVDHDVSGTGPTSMAWLGHYLPSSFAVDHVQISADANARVLPNVPNVTALADYDDLTPGTSDLAIGWLWATGLVVVDGEPTQILRPLVSRSVSVDRSIAGRLRSLGTRLKYLGNWDLWPLVADLDLAAELEQTVPFGGGALDAVGTDWQQGLVDRLTFLRTWTNDVLRASGLPPVRTLTAVGDPRSFPSPGLRVCVGAGLFAIGAPDSLRPRESLASWSNDAGAASTAFADLYLGPTRPPPPPVAVPGPFEVRSPLPLTPAQARALVHARSHPVTVVSGPPGTGKSQTAAAIALDAVDRGQSVLVATQSRMAADVLAGLLDRVPGPTPVLFGGGSRTSTLAAKLADGIEAPADTGASERAQRALADAAALHQSIAIGLGDVDAARRWSEASIALPAHLATAPRLLDPDGTCAPADARSRLARVHAVRGPVASWRRRRAERALRSAVGAPLAATVDQIAAAIELAALRDRARRADRPDPQRPARWAAFAEADARARHDLGDSIAERVANRASADARRAVGALSAALRSGRAVRRAHLLRVDVEALTDALPLWIGTLGDLESLLPARAGAFDLVILDEASMIDQMAASGALLRAKRVVVIGDPRQLRFVSFLADADVQRAISQHRLQPVADRLDLRRVSSFDLAASAAPVQFLDEHFRSVPHLIGFSAQRFYDGRLKVATRGPSNDGVRAIELRTLGGDRANGVNQVEVEAATAIAAELLTTSDLSVGIISPYRPQVDALRDALIAVVPGGVLQSGRARVGSVHGFQGTECDVVVASFGISDGTGRSRRFLEDPHLFNVLITRARRRMIVLVSVDDPPSGILADYLRWAEAPAPVPPDRGPADGWTEDVARVLRDNGTEVRVGYEIGRWTSDLVVGPPDGAIAVSTRVHPDGVDRHIERYLALHRLGWRQAEAFAPSGPSVDAVTTALALANLLTP